MVTRLRILFMFFPKLLIYGLSFLIPRKKKQWALSSWEGMSFADNGKYLFLELEKNPEDIDYWWITKNEKLYHEMKTFTPKVLLWPSLPAFFKLIRSSVVITTHSKNDLVPELIGGALHVELYHASFPIKKMGYDDKKLFTGKLKDHLKLRLLDPYIFSRPDYSIASSSLTQKMLSGILGIQENQIFNTGFPRIDILSSNSVTVQDQKKIESICDFSKFSHFFYYVPTFRRDKSFSFFDFGFSADQLIKFLEEVNGVLVIRMHPFDLQKYKKTFNVQSERIIFENHGLQDPYPLLKRADVLITDFSSIFSDYLFLKRPIVFALFDLEGYLRTERNLYVDPKKDFPGEIVQNWPELISTLKKTIQGYDPFAQNRESAKQNIFESFSSENSRRVIEKIKELENSN